MISVGREIDAPAAAVWAVLTDTTVWPVWGPTVFGATLAGGGDRIGPGSRGRLTTVGGVRLPFEVTEWDEGRRWAWKVAGVAATAHAVRAEANGPAGCWATIEVPSWAPFYVPVVRVALGRIARLART